VAFDGTNICVTNENSHTMSKIDPNTNKETAIVDVGTTPGTQPTGVAFDGTNIWATSAAPNTVTKIVPF